jgi:hypothetical protein
LITKYPHSDFAVKAREELAKIKPDDKQEPAPQKKYEETPKTGKAAVGDTPGVFEDPVAPPPKKGPQVIDNFGVNPT